MQGKKPSECINEFVHFLEESKKLYEMAKSKCEEFDSMERLIYWSHKFELAKDKSERNRLATAYQKERRERRKYKDICDQYKAVYGFINSDNNKSILKRMKGLIGNQRQNEKYLESDRSYKAGVKNDTTGG